MSRKYNTHNIVRVYMERNIMQKCKVSHYHKERNNASIIPSKQSRKTDVI